MQSFWASLDLGSGASMLARLLCALLLIAPALAQNQLKMVVILTRHGVRSPLSPMSNYAKDSWPLNQPDWGVDCCGDLTPSGEQLVRLMGAYYRNYYRKQGLLPAGCPDKQVYIWADNEERTIQTGRELAQGLADGSPGCSISVQSLTYNPPGCSPSQNDTTCQRGKAGPNDPLFHLPPTSDPDPQLQAIANDINRRYPALKAKYLNQLQALQDTLGCPPKPSAPCLLQLDPTASVKDGKLNWGGPFNVGSTASEIFLLEYANGMPCAKVGWNKVIFNKPDCSLGRSFRDMQEIHTAYFQETQRAPYIAAIQGTNLLSEIVRKLEQAQRPNPPAQKLVIFSGHDTIIANIAAMLGLSWKLPDLPENDTPPAGALVFELYKDPQKGAYSVRVRYVYQMLDQLRTKAALAVDHPPKWVDVPIPACKGDCDLERFKNRAVQRHP
jgi:4-phytase / acid phosphatase